MVIMKNGIPIDKNKVLLTAPKIRAVSCSEMMVIPISRSAVTLVSIFSIFLYKFKAFLLLEDDKIDSILDPYKCAVIILTILYPENLKYRLSTNILTTHITTNISTVIPNLRVII